MARMAPLEVEALSPEQKRVYDQIAGKRKTVRGPFPMWLRNPKLAEHANQFGVALRDHSVIGRRIFAHHIAKFTPSDSNSVCLSSMASRKRQCRCQIFCQRGSSWSMNSTFSPISLASWASII